MIEGGREAIWRRARDTWRLDALGSRRGPWNGRYELSQQHSKVLEAMSLLVTVVVVEQ